MRILWGYLKNCLRTCLNINRYKIVLFLYSVPPKKFMLLLLLLSLLSFRFYCVNIKVNKHVVCNASILYVNSIIRDKIVVHFVHVCISRLKLFLIQIIMETKRLLHNMKRIIQKLFKWYDNIFGLFIALFNGLCFY